MYLHCNYGSHKRARKDYVGAHSSKADVNECPVLAIRSMIKLVQLIMVHIMGYKYASCVTSHKRETND